MSERANQLALAFPVTEQFGADDFLISDSNELAYAFIESWPDWPDRIAMLVGPKGSGKSHLSAIWARRAHGWAIRPHDLVQQSIPHLVSNGALLVDGVDDGGWDEAALFHLVNAARSSGCYILMTAAHTPSDVQFRLPDLLSRLRLAPVLRIDQPDDGLLRSVIVKMFLDRQLIVDTAVVEAILRKGDRSFDAARALVERLDRRALETGRRITRQSVHDLLSEA